jgi:hypothetical protein
MHRMKTISHTMVTVLTIMTNTVSGQETIGQSSITTRTGIIAPDGGRPRISEAYFPYDPPHGIFGFFRCLFNQRYDSWIIYGRTKIKAKVYAANILGMPGFMITTTDPKATVMAYEVGGRHNGRNIKLTIMEVTTTYKIVYVRMTEENRRYFEIRIVITSPEPTRLFDFFLQGYCD